MLQKHDLEVSTEMYFSFYLAAAEPFRIWTLIGAELTANGLHSGVLIIWFRNTLLYYYLFNFPSFEISAQIPILAQDAGSLRVSSASVQEKCSALQSPTEGLLPSGYFFQAQAILQSFARQ